jgi:hypothetical protein
VIADHSRAATFLISDGVIPSNEGRGYVLRKIIRRAITHGRLLGQTKPFLHQMVFSVRDLMQDAYPELNETVERVSKAVLAEETRFAHTMEVGLKKLEEDLQPLTEAVRKDPTKQLVYPGEKAFKLYDTFGMPLDFAHPLQLAVALPTTVLSLGMLGLLLASTFVLYRNANAFSNLLEYPVWLATGLLVPLTLLPGWVAPIGWVLSPTWGMRAIRQAAFGGNAWPEIALCVGLGIAYVALGALALRNFERLARSRATLSLT